MLWSTPSSPHNFYPVTQACKLLVSSQEIAPKGRAFQFMWPLHWAGPYPVCWWPSKNLLGPFLWKVDCAACFTDWPCDLHNKKDCSHGQTWAEFRIEFICDCPRRGPNSCMDWRKLSTIKATILLKVCWWFSEWVDQQSRLKAQICAEIPDMGWAPSYRTNCLSSLWSTSNDIPRMVWCCHILCNEITLWTLRSNRILRSLKTNCHHWSGSQIANPSQGLPTPGTLCFKPMDAVTPSIGFASRPPQDPTAWMLMQLEDGPKYT